MGGLNQLSSAVLTAYSRSVPTKPKDESVEVTHRTRYDSIYVSGGFYLQNSTAATKRAIRMLWVCVRVMNHNAAGRRLHSSSLKTITRRPCRWQPQWCPPRSGDDVCGQGRAVTTGHKMPKQSRWQMCVAGAGLPVQSGRLRFMWRGVRCIIMTFYVSTSSEFGDS